MNRFILGLIFISFVCFNAQGTLYFSQGNIGQSFSDLTNWNTQPNGSGTAPLVGELTDGTGVFLVSSGHTVQIDSDIIIDALLCDAGSSVVEIGNDATVRNVTIVSSIYLGTGGTIRSQNSTVTHTLNLTGANASITNNGNISLVNGNSITNLNIAGTGTINLTSSPNRAVFNNIMINGGGKVNTSGNLDAYGDLNLINSSKLTGTSTFRVRGKTSVAIGSTIDLSAGSYRVEGTTDQEIECVGNCFFNNLYLGDNVGASSVKTITGDVTMFNSLRVYGDAVLAGSDVINVQSQIRTYNGAVWNGTGIVNLGNSSSTASFNTDNNSLELGTSKLIINGNTNFTNADLIMDNDLELLSGINMVMNSSSTIMEKAATAHTFIVGDLARLYVRAFDNFPDFSNYSISTTSRVDYDGTGVQQIKGGFAYGDLYIRYSTKYAQGDIDVEGDLMLRGTTFNVRSITPPIANYNLNVAEDVTGSAADLSTINSLTNFTLDGVDVNQTLSQNNTYNFENFIIDNVGPITNIRTKNIDTDIIVNGDFTATNSGGDASNLMLIDIDDNSLIANGGTFTLNDNVQFLTSGATSFEEMFDATLPSFGAAVLSDNSIVEFDRSSDQDIPGLTYGHILLDNDGIKGLTGDIIVNGNVDGDRDGLVFTDNGNTVTLYGNWNFGDFGSGLLRTNMTGDFIFAGGDQTSNESNFNNVIFQGPGVKTILYTIDANCAMTIETGVTVTSIYDIYVGCDLTINGTGKLTQGGQELFLDGTTGNQNITVASPKNSYVNNLELRNSSGTTILNSDFVVKGRVNFVNGTDIVLDMDGDSLFVGGDFLMYAEDDLSTTGGVLVFDGAADQTIRNGNPATRFNDMYFRTGGEKNFTTNTFVIEGDVVSDAGLTLDQNGTRINVAGDWTHLGSMAGGVNDDVYFDGAAQTIRGLEFNSVHFSGTAVKTMAANSSVKGHLYIENGSELDVSPTNYNLTIEGNWYNDEGGIFNARAGKVTINGGSSNMYTGGIGAGNKFYDLVIELSAPANTCAIANGASGDDNLEVDNDFSIVRGIMYTNSYDYNIGGDLVVSTGGRYYSNNGNHNLIFDGTAGTRNWQPGASDIYRQIEFNADPAEVVTWELNADVTISGSENIVISNGKLDLNHHSLSMSGNDADFSILGSTAELEIDSGASLTMGNSTNSDFLNSGGTLTLVGTPTGVATITTTGSFQFTQTDGVISANYYQINGTNTNGIDIQGGSVDATNNFSNGVFSGGYNNAYLTFGATVFGAPSTLQNVTFNERSNGNPTSNVAYSGGNVLTFEDAKGSSAGAGRELDDFSATTGQVRWLYNTAFFWDGNSDGDGDNTSWEDRFNWSTDIAPSGGSDVILDHSLQAAGYTVNIDAEDAIAASLTIQELAGTPNIKLDLNGFNLTSLGDVSNARGEIEQSNATDTLFVGGGWSNTSGELDDQGTEAVIVFSSTGGNHNISTNSNNVDSRNLNNVVVQGAGYYTFTDQTEIENNITVVGGTIDIGDASNQLFVQGDFVISDSGSFVHSNGRLRMEGTTGTQILDMGGNDLYNVRFEGGSKKSIASNMIVSNDFRIEATSDSVLGGENLIYVNHDWRNLKGDAGFKQTGNGSVVFNGATTQDIGQSGDASTIFNTVIFQSTGSKVVEQSFTINKDLFILMGNSGATIEIQPGVSIDGVGSDNDLLMQDGILRIESANGFPANFELVNMLGGQVRYQSNGINQNIYATEYYQLRIREVGGSLTTKTALGDITVNNTFYNTDDVFSKLDMNCNTLTLNGAIDIQPSAPDIEWGSCGQSDCQSGGSLVVGDGISALDIDLVSFNNLTIDNSGNREFRLQSDITVNGNLEFKNSSLIDMRQFTITNTCADVTNTTEFLVESNVQIETQVASGSDALPSGFGSISLSTSSLVEYQLGGDQDIFTDGGNLIYGDLDLEGSGAKTLDGNLHVDGSFNMDGSSTLSDNNFNMVFSGDLAAFNTYVPSVGTNVLFDGNDQIIRSDNSNLVDFRDVEFTGTGTKLFWDDETYNFLGDFKVGENVIIDMATYDQDVSFSGDSIIVLGALSHNGGDNDFRFNKVGTQIVDLGSNHDLAHLEVKTGADVYIKNFGLNVTGNGGTQNFVEVETGSSLDLDTMTHVIGQDNFIIDGTLIATNANLTFNQTGEQNLDAFIANNVILTGTGDKDMEGIWRMNDLTISGSARLDFDDEDTLVVRGNFDCFADIDREDGLVLFEIDDSEARTIRTNNEDISQFKFKSIGGNTALYTMLDDLNIDDSVRIGTGATLDMNGNTFTLGSPNDGGGSDEGLIIDAGAELQLDEGASLLVECNGTDANIDVFGTFSILGSSTQSASISRYAGNNEIDIDVLAGGTIRAQNYVISNLVDEGLLIVDGASIDPVLNFSNGTFSNMQEGVGATYLTIEADVSSLDTIKNITFSHSGPAVDSDYNVTRIRTNGGELIFGDDVLGLLAGEEYERESTGVVVDGQIIWPTKTETNWLGTVSADWFNASNWDNGVPDSSKNAIITSRLFNPVIDAGTVDTVKCKQLLIEDNGTVLTINDGIDLLIESDFILGTGSENSSVIINSNSSDIIIGGSWTTSTNATFTNGGAKVIFNLVSGTATIDIGNLVLNDIVFEGSASFNISDDLDIDGDVIISNGSVNPSSNNYVFNVGGDWDASGGFFNDAVNGTVVFDGGAQVITSANFDQVTFSGTGCDVLEGNVVFTDDLIINNCVVAAAGSMADFDGDVTINALGSFDDGGETHNFSGNNWIGTGSFISNTGTINFDRAGGTQNIFASTFNNLTLNSTSRIEMEGDINARNDVYISNTINNFFTQKYLLDNTGVGTLTIESGENIYVDGADNFPSNFDVYALDATSNTRYNGTADQTIRGGVTYGNLSLTNANTKTLSGDIVVLGDVVFGASTLDVSPFNYSISVGDDWSNGTGGSFIARKGTVTFNGTTNQGLNPGEHPTDGVKKFWNVVVNKASDIVDVNVADIYIDSNLTVTSGEFTLAGVGNGWTGYIGGSLITTGTGTLGNTGTFYFNSDDNATLDISIQGNNIRDVIINATSNTTYEIGSDFTVDGNFNLMVGNIDGNNQTVELGTDINDAVTISGLYDVNNGVLALGNQTSLSVTSSGEFDIVGSQSDPSIVTRRYSTGDYNFSVNGTIKARDYVFENFSAQGISINSTATIDLTDNFSDGTFANPASAGTCLRIENTQKFTNANRIENVSFPQDPGNGTYNVTKVIAATDSIEFYNASGALAGESKDNDPLDIIIWTGSNKLTWTGAVSTDWYDVNNWSIDAGTVQVPDSTFDVIIPVVSNQPIITESGAQAKLLTVESGAILTIQTPNDTASDITIFDELLLEGLLSTQTVNDVIEINGNWTRNGGGTYLYGSGGKVLFTGDVGTVTINNGGASFYDLEINRTGLVYLSTDINVDNDLNIVQGTLDVSTSSYDITVNGSFTNDDGFNSRSGTVTMTSSSSETIKSNGSAFYNLTVEGSGSFTGSGTISVDNRYSQTAGVFDLNGQIFKAGNASGVDLFTVTGGEFIVDENSNLQLSNNADISISSGGKISLIGTDLSNPAKVSNQGGSSKYNFDISSGGLISALYYEIEDLGINGLNITSSATVNPTNNLSYGVFRDGSAGGSYITFRSTQDLSGNDRIEYVEFETNPGGGATNARKTSASGTVEFYYAIGPFSGETFENDPNDLVEWDADMVWTGVNGSDWNDPLNWDATLSLVIPNLIPNDTTDVIIPNVATTDPILNVTGFSDDLIVEAGGGFLTMNSGNDLTVSGDVSIEGVLTIDPASVSSLNVYGSWNSTVGTFNSGNNSLVSFYTETGTVTLNSDDTFCGLQVNSQGAGTGVVQTASSIDVDCDFVVVNGTFEIGDPSHTFNIAGNWDNQSLAASAGFNESTGTVIFDGGSDQSITHAGGNESFYNITIQNSASEVNLNDNIIVLNDLVIQASSVLDAQTSTISLDGNWVNNNTVGFNESSSTVEFTGSAMQLITHAGAGETFFNLTLNNDVVGTALLPAGDLTVTNVLTQTDGIITTGVNELVLTSSVATNYTGWGTENFVNGNLRRSIATNTSTYSFPVAKGLAGTDYYLIEIINGSLTGTSTILGSVSSITESGTNVDADLDVKEGPASGAISYNAVMGETAIWTLTPNIQPTGGDYGIDAYITNFTGLSDSMFAVLKRTEGSVDYADWDDAYPAAIPAAGATGRMVADGFARRTGYTSFSEFSIGISSQPLPIELKSFNAKSKDGHVLLTWVTVTENNNDYFTIQRSLDGVSFEDIGSVKGAGNSSTSLNYNFIDSNPYNGISYYRLVQTDYNGDFESFDIKSVEHVSNKVVQLYPSPVVDVLTIKGVGLVGTNTQVKVYSILGDLIFVNEIKNDTSNIDLSSLRSGMYTVVVSNNQFNYTEVIIVTK